MNQSANLGLCGFEVNEIADSKAYQSIKEGRDSHCYYQWQILEPSGKGKAKWSFTVSIKTPKGKKLL
jgi:hypothetical protein